MTSLTRPALPTNGRPRLSVIIPTLDEERLLPGLLSDLTHVPDVLEVLVVDGGSSDSTRDVATREGARVIVAERGRGRQLAAGAHAATGELFLFLHADVRLPAPAREAVSATVGTLRAGALVFRLGIDAPGAVFRLVERTVDLRTRFLGLPYGDQGLLVTRADYLEAGGYRDIPLMEDVALVRSLRRRCGIQLLDAPLLVSARRWEQDGVWRRTFLNWCLITAYSAGVSPTRLARWYRPAGS